MPELSRRGFFSRGLFGIGAIVGGSVLGNRASRAWAKPSTNGKRKSAVLLSSEETAKREKQALELSEFKSLLEWLTGLGFSRQEAVAADGVAGYATEGNRMVSIVLKPSSSSTAIGATLTACWPTKGTCGYDRVGEVSVDATVFKRESSGVVAHQTLLVDGEFVTTNLASNQNCSAIDIHTHPPGPLPPGCIAAIHMYLPTGICFDCSLNATCLALCNAACQLLIFPPARAACMAACVGACQDCELTCCDYVDTLACVQGPPR